VNRNTTKVQKSTVFFTITILLIIMQCAHMKQRSCKQTFAGMHKYTARINDSIRVHTRLDDHFERNTDLQAQTHTHRQ